MARRSPRPTVYVGCAGWSVPKEHAAGFPAAGSHLERYAGTFPATGGPSRPAISEDLLARPSRQASFKPTISLAMGNEGQDNWERYSQEAALLPDELQTLSREILSFLRTNGQRGLHKVDLMHSARGSVWARSKRGDQIGTETCRAFTEDEVLLLASTIWDAEGGRTRVVIKYANPRAKTGWNIREILPRTQPREGAAAGERQ